jgi:hypothetical protein
VRKESKCNSSGKSLKNLSFQEAPNAIHPDIEISLREAPNIKIKTSTFAELQDELPILYRKLPISIPRSKKRNKTRAYLEKNPRGDKNVGSSRATIVTNVLLSFLQFDNWVPNNRSQSVTLLR